MNELIQTWATAREKYGDGSADEQLAWDILHEAWKLAVSSRGLPASARKLARLVAAQSERRRAVLNALVGVSDCIADAVEVVRDSGCSWRKQLSVEGVVVIANRQAGCVMVRVVDRGETIASDEF